MNSSNTHSVADKMAAFKEASADTALALSINFPLNILLLYIAQSIFDMDIFWTSVFMTAIFTIFAIVRKTLIRLHFDKKNRKKQQQTT